MVTPVCFSSTTPGAEAAAGSPRRDLLRSSSTSSRHASMWHRLQPGAAARPESRLVQTPSGGIWMSPIESKLNDAMVAEGLSPVPQYCIES